MTPEGAKKKYLLTGALMSPVLSDFSRENLERKLGACAIHRVSLIMVTFPAGNTPTAVDAGGGDNDAMQISVPLDHIYFQ